MTARKLVPREPTPEMLNAAYEDWSSDETPCAPAKGMRARWIAMYDAAPSQEGAEAAAAGATPRWAQPFDDDEAAPHYPDQRPEAASATRKDAAKDGSQATIGAPLASGHPQTLRDGNFLDALGCCKVCDGEIPDGHNDNCDVWKLEAQVAKLGRELEEIKKAAEASAETATGLPPRDDAGQPRASAHPHADLCARLRKDVVGTYTAEFKDHRDPDKLEAADRIEALTAELAEAKATIKLLDACSRHETRRAEKAEAEVERLRECVRAADAMRVRIDFLDGNAREEMVNMCASYDAARARCEEDL